MDYTKGYDKNSKKWKIRTKDFTDSKTIYQLSEIFGVDLGQSAEKSAPYWRKYVRMRLDKIAASRVAATPIGYQIIVPKASAKPVQQTDALKGWTPVFPDQDEFKGSLDHEIQEFLKLCRTANQYKNSLAAFRQAVGNLPVKLIDVEVYRKWLDSVVANHAGVQVTSLNKIKGIKTFLRHIATLYDLPMTFIENKKLHQLNLPDLVERNLDDEYWTVEGIRKAYECHDFPLARFSFLMGLNCGCYDSDIEKGYFSTDKIKNGYYTSGRAKLLWNGSQKGRVQSYKLWPETQAAVVLATKRQLNHNFAKMRKALGINKSQKALRKTGAVHIEQNYALEGELMVAYYRNQGEIDVQKESYLSKKSSKSVVEILAEATDRLHPNVIQELPN